MLNKIQYWLKYPVKEFITWNIRIKCRVGFHQWKSYTGDDGYGYKECWICKREVRGYVRKPKQWHCKLCNLDFNLGLTSTIHQQQHKLDPTFREMK